jgi:error-prone DNA polymerase
MIAVSFVHLHVHSPFSFLDGAGRLEELVEKAAFYEMPALAITDHDNLAVAVFFHDLCSRAGIKPLQGAEVTLEKGYHLVLLARDASGYSNLCRLLTRAHLDHPRGQPRTSHALLKKFARGIIALSGCRQGEIPSLVFQRRYQEALEKTRLYQDMFGQENFHLELENPWLPGAREYNRHLVQLSETTGAPLIATNNVHYAVPEQFPLHDLLTCIRTSTRLEEVHRERRLNDENYLKGQEEMADLFSSYPEALKNTVRLAEECQSPLQLDEKLHPSFPLPSGETAAGFLRRLVYSGAKKRYRQVKESIVIRLEKELEIINSLGYADYFLLVWDVVNFARSRGIRCAGRGSAADSLVSYCLFLTEVDSWRRGLLFERFLSPERAEKPDIDIDFDARHRDRVAAYVYEKYGEEHVAAVCTYNTYQARSAVRDLAGVLDFPREEADYIAKLLPHAPADAVEVLLENLPELKKSRLGEEKYRQLFHFCREIAGLPRFLGTHLGGLVISRLPLTQLTPLQRAAKGVVVTQFDKEAVERLGLVKLDLLSLRTMSVLEDTIEIIEKTDPTFTEKSIPHQDQETFAMINRGETMGVFQLESPAQRALQSQLGASELEDLVASLALIRPGPIKGNMVGPFIARHQGLEEVTYLHPSLEPILKKTKGVVLFQEQVIQIAMVIAGFTPGEADRLRRVMSHSRSRREMEELGRFFVSKAVARGMELSLAEKIFSQIAGYASYGFCEAHAAAFAETSYKTAYLVCHYPAEYFAALLSHQPMGYYGARTLGVEARRRGINFLPPDINKSGADFTVEEGAIRISLRQVREMTGDVLARILQKRPYRSWTEFCRQVKAPRHLLQNLIFSGAFDSLHPNRKQLLWQIPFLPKGFLENGMEVSGIEDFSEKEKRRQELEVLGMEIDEHEMVRWRERLKRAGFLDSHSLKQLKDGVPVKTAGLFLYPLHQFPVFPAWVTPPLPAIHPVLH